MPTMPASALVEYPAKIKNSLKIAIRVSIHVGKWRSWATSIPVGFPQHDLSGHPELEKVRREPRTIKEKIRYPHALQNIMSHDNMGYNIKFTNAIRNWAQTIQPDLFEPEDINDKSFSTMLYILIQAWSLIVDSTGRGEKEFSTRRGSDLIIELAFKIRTDGQHDVLFEEEVVLPLPQENFAF
ncbi:hypothetical protein DFH11DRAFT_1631197 [Phellopilus nigrolimitatus]|nr:hypothetical protein DFH11DRAFT_1631197 [Phellopilus nigrolimitatus]